MPVVRNIRTGEYFDVSETGERKPATKEQVAEYNKIKGITKPVPSSESGFFSNLIKPENIALNLLLPGGPGLAISAARAIAPEWMDQNIRGLPPTVGGMAGMAGGGLIGGPPGAVAGSALGAMLTQTAQSAIENQFTQKKVDPFLEGLQSGA